MKNIRTTAAVAAIACLAALSAVPASAAVISNPTNTDSFVYLSGAGTGGGQQTQFVGETFTAPISGAVTNFQFTLNSSALPSLYGAIYAWDGSQPTTLLWQSPVVSASAGLLDFSPVGANVTQGQTYVAFLSTYGIDQNGHSNAGSATRRRLPAVCRLQLELDPQSRQSGVCQRPGRRAGLAPGRQQFPRCHLLCNDHQRRPRADHLGDADPRFRGRRTNGGSAPQRAAGGLNGLPMGVGKAAMEAAFPASRLNCRCRAV
jgi:hypothetical protein